ncbi:hypothetical protein BOTBODRAFT_69660 [Botryobasidium botryosum FD-172 SS1]|uniref:Uncharacterized protein n=1 Tax=Botryobasidium botryosum (strain FD-172 SS1) TaxID=930990 RepID=A0A067M1L0_BOTB1|nr:hypothetical protein BOTBODRAFT_69660 [Botryobasidium botryosum FD-172 SS1]
MPSPPPPAPRARPSKMKTRAPKSSSPSASLKSYFDAMPSDGCRSFSAPFDNISLPPTPPSTGSTVSSRPSLTVRQSHLHAYGHTFFALPTPPNPRAKPPSPTSTQHPLRTSSSAPTSVAHTVPSSPVEPGVGLRQEDEEAKRRQRRSKAVPPAPPCTPEDDADSNAISNADVAPPPRPISPRLVPLPSKSRSSKPKSSKPSSSKSKVNVTPPTPPSTELPSTSKLPARPDPNPPSFRSRFSTRAPSFISCPSFVMPPMNEAFMHTPSDMTDISASPTSPLRTPAIAELNPFGLLGTVQYVDVWSERGTGGAGRRRGGSTRWADRDFSRIPEDEDEGAVADGSEEARRGAEENWSTCGNVSRSVKRGRSRRSALKKTETAEKGVQASGDKSDCRCECRPCHSCSRAPEVDKNDEIPPQLQAVDPPPPSSATG